MAGRVRAGGADKRAERNIKFQAPPQPPCEREDTGLQKVLHPVIRDGHCWPARDFGFPTAAASSTPDAMSLGARACCISASPLTPPISYTGLGGA